MRERCEEMRERCEEMRGCGTCMAPAHPCSAHAHTYRCTYCAYTCACIAGARHLRVLIHPHHCVGRVVVAEVHRVGADPLAVGLGLQLREHPLHEAAHLGRWGGVGWREARVQRRGCRGEGASPLWPSPLALPSGTPLLLQCPPPLLLPHGCTDTWMHGGGSPAARLRPAVALAPCRVAGSRCRRAGLPQSGSTSG